MSRLAILRTAASILLLSNALEGAQVLVQFEGEVTWTDLVGISRGQPVTGKIQYDNKAPGFSDAPEAFVEHEGISRYEIRIGTTVYLMSGGPGNIVIVENDDASHTVVFNTGLSKVLGPDMGGFSPSSMVLQLLTGLNAVVPSLALSAMPTRYDLAGFVRGAEEPDMGISFELGGDLQPRVLIRLSSLAARPYLPPLGPGRAPDLAIHLEDIVAGGDGSNNAPSQNVGIDPRTGEFTTTYFDGPINDTDGINPSVVQDSPFIDSVFLFKGNVPTAQDGCVGCFLQDVTQSGVQLQVSDVEETNSAWNYILKNRVGGVSTPGLLVGSQSHFASAIGIHASAGITFDLDALRERHGQAAVGCFKTFLGMDGCSTGRVRLTVLFSSDAQGILAKQEFSLSPNLGLPLTLQIPDNARYLTLASSSVNGNQECDHGTFARPIITPLPCPDDFVGWIWRAGPSRVSPAGENIIIEGEALYPEFSIRVNGTDLPGQVFLSNERRQARTPPLPPGVHDLEIAQSGTLLGRFPGALEVVAPPEIFAVSPEQVLTDRLVLCRVFGQNLRSDMAVLIPSSDQGAEALLDQVLFSPELITGYIPRPVPPRLSISGADTIALLDQGRLREFSIPLILYVDQGIEKMEPSLLPTAGGAVVTVVGRGFVAGMTFRIGTSPLSDVEILESGFARGKTPPLAPGLHSISLLDPEGVELQTLEDQVFAQETASTAIAGFVPLRVSTRGGDVVAITTQTWHGGATVRLGGLPLANLEATDVRVLRGESPPLAPGFHPLELIGADGDVLARVENAIEAIPPASVSVSGVSPFEVSTSGGTPLTLTGTGFEPGLVPRLGGLPLAAVEVVSGTQLRGLSPPLSEGLHDLTLTEGEAELARFSEAVHALPLITGPAPVLGRPPATHFAAGIDSLEIAATQVPEGAVLRVGGVPVLPGPLGPCGIVGGEGGGGGIAGGGGHAVFGGIVPELSPGRYAVDLYLPGLGVLATLDEAIDVIASTSPPLASHVVSTDVLPDGSTRLHIFGSCFGPGTRFVLGGKPISDAEIVSPRLAIGHAPALGDGEVGGPRTLEVLDPRGNSSLVAAVVYVDVDGDINFVRGDANQSGSVDISDAVTILGFLFLGNPSQLDCLEAANIDEGASVDLSDAVLLLGHLFLGGPAPRAPYPTCGAGSPASTQGCASFGPCGSGGGDARGRGGAAAGGLKANVFVLAEERTAPGEPILRDVSPVSGEVVIDDPPGGLDLEPGDIIAGYVPATSAAIHEGVTYLVKLEGVQPPSCLATQPGDRTYASRPATLAETFTDAAIDFQMPGAAAERRISSEAVIATGNTRCDLAEESGLGGGEEGAGGAFDPLIDVTFEGLSVFSWQDGPNYIHAGFHRLRVLYAASEASLGVGISGTRLTSASFFSGILLDTEIFPYIDSHFEQHIAKEKKLLTLRKDHVVVVFGVPIHFAATGDLYAGVNLDAQVNLYADAGAKAHFKAGVGFRFDGTRIQNLSGIDPPTLEPIPGTPNLDLNGALVVKGYVRPETHLFAGILFRGLTADIGTRSEAFLRLHAEGETQPVPCFRWGLDAGMKVTLIPEIQLFGYDLFDRTFDVINAEELNLLGDEYGCKVPPVPRVTYHLVRLDAEGTRYEVHLDASESYDPDGGPLRYRWDFDADGQCDLATLGDPRATVVIENICLPFEVRPFEGQACSTVRGMILRVTDDEDASVEGRFKVVLR